LTTTNRFTAASGIQPGSRLRELPLEQPPRLALRAVRFRDFIEVPMLVFVGERARPTGESAGSSILYSSSPPRTTVRAVVSPAASRARREDKARASKSRPSSRKPETAMVGKLE
jgi:hypothetical protein